MTKSNFSPAGPNARPERADARLGRERVNSEDGRSADNPGRGGELILIPKQLRMEWTDVMGRDPDLPATALKVAVVIGSHFNHRTGDTYVSQEKVAEIMRVSLRTVRTAIGELEGRGYLIVGRRDLGKRESDGRRVCGGRGTANTYAPALDGRQLTAIDGAKRLASRAEAVAEERRQRVASFKGLKEAADCLLSEGERRQSGVTKEAMGCLPTLNDTSYHNPPPGSAGARRVAPAHPLGYAAELLDRRLGDRKFETWFKEVTVIGLIDGTLTLGTVKAFNRDWLTRWCGDVEVCWNKANPAKPIKRVEFVVVKGSSKP